MLKFKDEILLGLYALLLFTPFLGSVHLFDWDEINFAESAREMLITQNWFQVQINFEPFWEKPPLFFWLQVLSMKVFGVNEFAARFPNALCGIITLQVLFALGKKHHGRPFGWTWALLYSGSFLPHLYFKSGIIDPWFNLFIFLSIYFIYTIVEHENRRTNIQAILAGLFCGLAVLTKGPVALLLLLLTFFLWLLINRFKRAVPLKAVMIFAATSISITFLWFGMETIVNGPWFLIEFITYQIDLLLNPVAGHAQPFYYHFIVVLIGCFPLSILALSAFSNRFSGDQDHLSTWMKYLFWVVMILFSLVTTKIVHYSSMAYLPLSYLAALVAYRTQSQHRKLPYWQNIWITIQGVFIGLALLLIPIAIWQKKRWIHLIKDQFTKASLNIEVDLLGIEWLIGVAYLLIVLWAFKLNQRSTRRALPVISIGTALTIFSVMPLIVPVIEQFSQRPAIAFFQDQVDKNVFVETYGYKSYAHYFYSKIQPENAHHMDEHHLQSDQRPIMISVKINRLEKFQEEYPNAKHLYTKGGFAFYHL